MIKIEELLKQELDYNQEKLKEESKKEQFDISRIPYVIEDLVGTFNSIKMGFPDGMTEERYKYFLEQLSYGFNDVVESIPLLKTNDQVRKEKEEKISMFNGDSKTINSAEQASDFEAFDWGEDFDWETQTDQNKFI